MKEAFVRIQDETMRRTGHGNIAVEPRFEKVMIVLITICSIKQRLLGRLQRPAYKCDTNTVGDIIVYT